MKFSRLFIFLAILALPTSAQTPAWREWNGVFERAQSEKKFVLLDMEAVWCHWCHVMDKTTYRDDRVLELLNQHFLCVKVDQDSRPDLSARYKDYGWPATILFDSSGRELARLSGYQNPLEMQSALERVLKDPIPLPEPKEEKRGKSLIDPSLEARHFRLYDEERGGWGSVHKFVNGPVLEYCLWKSLQGDAKNREMAKKTLTANLKLIDPVWGGVYQYSDSGRWDRPHFEKIMSTQASNLLVYSLAWKQFGDEEYLVAAENIARYLDSFLSAPDGAFYTSQDADVQPGQKATEYFALPAFQREALGIPRVDKNKYARENGWAIEALAIHSAVTGRKDWLKRAIQAADWVLKERALVSGGFSHGESAEQLFLGDTLACGKAFLALYIATGDKSWLARAEAAANFIERSFQSNDHDGFSTSKQSSERSREENVSLARFASLLYSYSGKESHQRMADKALAYFSIEGITDQWNPGGLLLAIGERRTSNFLYKVEQ